MSTASLNHIGAVASDPKLHHIASDHVQPEEHQHSHQHSTECSGCAAARNDHPLPKEVINMMASREHRMHHWLWHEVRNNWHRYPRDIQQKIDELGWKPPRCQ